MHGPGGMDWGPDESHSCVVGLSAKAGDVSCLLCGRHCTRIPPSEQHHGRSWHTPSCTACLQPTPKPSSHLSSKQGHHLLLGWSHPHHILLFEHSWKLCQKDMMAGAGCCRAGAHWQVLCHREHAGVGPPGQAVPGRCHPQLRQGVAGAILPQGCAGQGRHGWAGSGRCSCILDRGGTVCYKLGVAQMQGCAPARGWPRHTRDALCQCVDSLHPGCTGLQAELDSIVSRVRVQGQEPHPQETPM